MENIFSYALFCNKEIVIYCHSCNRQWCSFEISNGRYRQQNLLPVVLISRISNTIWWFQIRYDTQQGTINKQSTNTTPKNSVFYRLFKYDLRYAPTVFRLIDASLMGSFFFLTIPSYFKVEIFGHVTKNF